MVKYSSAVAVGPDPNLQLEGCALVSDGQTNQASIHGDTFRIEAPKDCSKKLDPRTLPY